MCPIFRRLVRPPSRTIETLKSHTKFSLKACGAYDGTSAYGLLRGGQGCAVLNSYQCAWLPTTWKLARPDNTTRLSKAICQPGGIAIRVAHQV